MDGDFLNIKNDLSDNKRPLRIEVCLTQKCKIKKQEIRNCLISELKGREILPHESTEIEDFQNEILTSNVSQVLVVNSHSSRTSIDEQTISNAEFCIFKLSIEDTFSEDLEEDAVVAEVTELPNKKLHGLWNSLTYDGSVKEDLLEYARSAMLFSDSKVDTNIVTWNRIILLHGPPGTGKTSLCRALAHKLSIMMSNRYRVSQLYEVNSHSLFSKWFSESGKLVMRMFQRVGEMVLDPDVLIFVLIDEVESLSGSRSRLGSNEPSETIRVVNALLTQLDSLKKYNNVIVIATSNLSKNIDPAFIDRVDISQFIGNPGQFAIYNILHSCICELAKRGVIVRGETDACLMSLNNLQLSLRFNSDQQRLSPSCQRLLAISQMAKGLSGRSLRKLPFLAHAMYLQTHTTTLNCFLGALEKAVNRQVKALSDTFLCH